MNGDIPYSAKVAIATMAQNRTAARCIVQECLERIAKDCTDIAGKYDSSDLPFVIAAMQISANAMMQTLSDSGRYMVHQIISHTATVAVDVEALRRQAEGDES